MVYSSQPGLLVGHVEQGQLTYPLTALRKGKTLLFRVGNTTNQMMSKQKECLNDYLWALFREWARAQSRIYLYKVFST